MGISEETFKPGPYYEISGFGEYDVVVVFGRHTDKEQAQAQFDKLAAIKVSNPDSKVTLYEVTKTPIATAFTGRR